MLDRGCGTKRLPIALLALVGTLFSIGLAGSTAAGSAINQTVVSITFDDGRVSQMTALSPLQSHNMHATFYLNSGSVGGLDFLSWAQVNALAAAGNEIGGHTRDHVNLPLLFQTDPIGAQTQVCADRDALLTNVPDTSVTSFSYPFGSSDASSVGDANPLEALVAGCGYTSARITQGILGSAPWCVTAGCPYAETIPPWDAYAVRATGSVTTTTTLAQMEAFVTNAEQNGGGWVPFVFHDIGVDTDGYSISAANFSAFLDWLAARESSGTIVRTVGEVMSGAVNPLPPGPNLLQNPSLEDTTTPGDPPDCWETSSYGSNTTNWTATADAHSGTSAFQGEIVSWTSGDSKLIVKRSSECAPAVIPGHSYRLTGWYKGTLSPYFAVYWTDGSSSWQVLATSPQFPQAGDWHQAAWTTPPAPAGAIAFSVGLAIAGETGQIVVDDFSLGDTAGPPPTVQITSPGSGGFISGSTATLSADASSDRGIDRVEFKIDGNPAGSVATSPYSLNWDSIGASEGDHTLEATAFGSNDLQSSDSVAFKVDNTPPDSSIACNGAVCNSDIYWTAVSATLAATDSGSGVAAVRYTLDGSEPTGSSPLYSDALTIAVTTTIRWRAWDALGNAEPVQSQQIRINEPPTVEVTAPASGGLVSGQTVILSAGASDDLGVASVELEIDGSPVDTISSSPYSLSWDSTTVADGTHTLTAIATDLASAQSSDSVTFTVDNTAPSGSLSAPAAGSFLRQSVSLTSDSADSGSGVASVAFQRSPAGAASWTTIASDTSSPYGVSWDTTALADGSYDLRVVTTDLAGNSHESDPVSVTVDNTAPSGSLSAPAAGSFLRQSVSLASDSADSGSGVASVAFQHSPAGAASWTTIASDTSSPYGGVWNTAALADGSYDLRVITTDLAGNSFVSAPARVRVDNTAPRGSLTTPVPGIYLRGAVALASNSADSGSGVASAAFQRSPTGAASWTTIAADASSPYGASWDTTALADGSYDLRVVTRDQAGNSFASAPVSVRVDNTAPTGSLTSPAPGSYLRRTVALGSNSADSRSGLASVAFQRLPAGTTTWVTIATDTIYPYGFDWNTAAIADGDYYLRVFTRDRAGNSFASTPVRVRVDNTAPVSSIFCNRKACRVSLVKRQVVAIRARDTGSGVRAIRFTLNGKRPNASSRLFKRPFTLAVTTKVRWRVWDRAGNGSRFQSRLIRIH